MNFNFVLNYNDIYLIFFSKELQNNMTIFCCCCPFPYIYIYILNAAMYNANTALIHSVK